MYYYMIFIAEFLKHRRNELQMFIIMQKELIEKYYIHVHKFGQLCLE